MTALGLLGYISAALLLQIAMFIAIAVCRYRRNLIHSVSLSSASSSSDENPDMLASAWQGLREFRVVGREFEDSAQTVCSFYLAPVDTLPLPHFLAGQFLTVSLQIEDMKKQTKILTRCYSLSDKPGLKHYRISIKRALTPVNLPTVLPGLVSNYFHDNIHQGDVIGIRAPSGQFYIDSESADSVVMIAGGIGITPLLSMLLRCVEHQPTRIIHFYYGVRNSREQPFKMLLENLAAQHANFHLNVVYSCPTEGDEFGSDHQHIGYVDIDLLRRTLPFGEHQFYICGPSPMMELLVPGLIECGISQKNIHYEAFGPASIRAYPIADNTRANLAFEVKFKKSGRTVIWDGRDQNLLDFAERNGIAIESGCRAGSCGSCQTQVVSGSVNYRDKPEYDIARGHCLLCVGQPESTLEIQA
jgi:uncharacterized protein